jgi:lipid-binding SYLF domain-containing protein
VTAGAESSIDTTTINDPSVGFVFGQKGLMYNLTLEGSKFIKPLQTAALAHRCTFGLL